MDIQCGENCCVKRNEKQCNTIKQSGLQYEYVQNFNEDSKINTSSVQ